MLSFHPNALFGSAEQQGCFEDLCPAQREGRSWYRDSMPAVQGKEIQPLDRASPLPSHILNTALEFGQYLILDLKGCVMCPVFYLGAIKCSVAPITVLMYFFRTVL